MFINTITEYTHMYKFQNKISKFTLRALPGLHCPLHDDQTRAGQTKPTQRQTVGKQSRSFREELFSVFHRSATCDIFLRLHIRLFHLDVLYFLLHAQTRRQEGARSRVPFKRSDESSLRRRDVTSTSSVHVDTCRRSTGLRRQAPTSL